MSLKVAFAALLSLPIVACSVAAPSDAESSGQAATTAHTAITDFVCTSSASSSSELKLRNTRLDVGIDVTVAGKPSGIILTGFEPSLDASSAVGFGVSHVRDTTVAGHAVSEYKIDFGADSILPGATGGTLTIPTAYTHLQLESSAALNVATLTLTPNATATFKCKKDTRKPDPGPVEDPLTFEGAAKDTVAHDACAKSVAREVMDQLVGVIEDDGLDVPDTFTFSKIDKTADGYETVVNGVKVSATVGAGCRVEKVDTSGAGSLGG